MHSRLPFSVKLPQLQGLLSTVSIATSQPQASQGARIWRQWRTIDFHILFSGRMNRKAEEKLGGNRSCPRKASRSNFDSGIFVSLIVSGSLHNGCINLHSVLTPPSPTWEACHQLPWPLTLRTSESYTLVLAHRRRLRWLQIGVDTHWHDRGCGTTGCHVHPDVLLLH